MFTVNRINRALDAKKAHNNFRKLFLKKVNAIPLIFLPLDYLSDK